jgi:hypothetical protein
MEQIKFAIITYLYLITEVTQYKTKRVGSLINKDINIKQLCSSERFSRNYLSQNILKWELLTQQKTVISLALPKVRLSIVILNKKIDCFCVEHGQESSNLENLENRNLFEEKETNDANKLSISANVIACICSIL